MQSNEIKFLSVEQVAERLSVSPDTIYRWKRNGDFPKAIKLSAGTTRWKLEDVAEWENSLKSCLLTDVTLSGFFGDVESGDRIRQSD